MSREAVLEAIAEAEYWHHRIPITADIVTPGAQDTAALLAQVGLPDDLSGLRVLDIGARDGFFSFLAEERGAAEVVALDNVPASHTGFDVAKRLIGSRVEYVVDNVYCLDAAALGTFDVVLFLGVLYHLRHPLLALDRIWDVCRPGARLFVETHMIDEGPVRNDGSWASLDAFNAELSEFSLVQFLPDRILGNDFTSKWAPNATALESLLRAAGFDIAESWRVAFRGGATAIARDLDPDGQRAVDAARSWDLVRGRVISGSFLSPPANDGELPGA